MKPSRTAIPTLRYRALLKRRRRNAEEEAEETSEDAELALAEMRSDGTYELRSGVDAGYELRSGT